MSVDECRAKYVVQSDGGCYGPRITEVGATAVVPSLSLSLSNIYIYIFAQSALSDDTYKSVICAARECARTW